MAAPILTAEELRERLNYDPETGIFTIKSSRFKNKIGDQAGWKHSKGYIGINLTVGGTSKHFYAHRLAWLYETGSWPEGQIDHINGIRDDNRIVNLRDVPQTHNMLNQAKPHRRNLVGLIGVSRTADGRRFSATLSYKGRPICVGTFVTAEEAHRTYMKAKQLLINIDPAHTDRFVNIVLSKDLSPDARGRLVNLIS